jgi:hypothetical protein
VDLHCICECSLQCAKLQVRDSQTAPGECQLLTAVVLPRSPIQRADWLGPSFQKSADSVVRVVTPHTRTQQLFEGENQVGRKRSIFASGQRKIHADKTVGQFCDAACYSRKEVALNLSGMAFGTKLGGTACHQSESKLGHGWKRHAKLPRQTGSPAVS